MSKENKKIRRIADALAVKPGEKIKLKDYDPEFTLVYPDKHEAKKPLEKNLEHLSRLEYLLYASKKKALLIILQGMDSSGKDGAIRHVVSALNPQSCNVTAFKVPTDEEVAHDFLWRVHKAVPPRGEIGVFNRSHYEEVLITRVHKLIAKEDLEKRYQEINAFEKILTENNVIILKFFLHISREEQKKRFEERLQNPDKHWKVNPADFKERKLWPEYVKAYEAVLTKCSTPWAPWYIIPANKKWFRNLAVSQIVEETLADLKMKFPSPAFKLSKLRLK